MSFAEGASSMAVDELQLSLTPLSFLEGEARVKAAHLVEDWARTAILRDRRGGNPKRERDQLRESGLLAAWIPKEHGGAGLAWPAIFDLVRWFARVDSSLAHVFGFQHLIVATARLFGSEAQWNKVYEETARARLFWGNALNPLDPSTSIRRRGDGYSVLGKKSFSSGSVDSDRLLVSALDEEKKLVVFAVPTQRAGISVACDWDNMGQRQTDSGSVEFRELRVEEAEIFRSPGPLGSVFSSLRPLIAQLVLTNVYLGLAEGALLELHRSNVGGRRAWVASGVETQGEDPYALHRVGGFFLRLETTRLLADRAAITLDAAFRRGEELSAEQRGAVAVRVALAKVEATRAALEITAGIFDVTGARSTTAALALDRYWRNARTHTLHDPVDYKIRELGRFALSEQLPEPSFYS